MGIRPPERSIAGDEMAIRPPQRNIAVDGIEIHPLQSLYQCLYQSPKPKIRSVSGESPRNSLLHSRTQKNPLTIRKWLVGSFKACFI